jgi:hypothetical protein
MVPHAYTDGLVSLTGDSTAPLPVFRGEVREEAEKIRSLSSTGIVISTSAFISLSYGKGRYRKVTYVKVR